MTSTLPAVAGGAFYFYDRIVSAAASAAVEWGFAARRGSSRQRTVMADLVQQQCW